MKLQLRYVLLFAAATSFRAAAQTVPTPAQLQQEIDTLSQRVAMVETKVNAPAPAEVPSGPTFHISAERRRGAGDRSFRSQRHAPR